MQSSLTCTCFNVAANKNPHNFSGRARDTGKFKTQGNYKNTVFVVQLFRKRLSEKVHATIPKGIVGGFEITVLHRNFERMAREAVDYVCEC